MTQLQDLPRCPKCGSADIEPTGHDLFPPPMASTETTPLSYSSDTMPPIRLDVLKRMERDASAIGKFLHSACEANHGPKKVGFVLMLAASALTSPTVCARMRSRSSARLKAGEGHNVRVKL